MNNIDTDIEIRVVECPKECKDGKRCIYTANISNDKTSKYEHEYYCGLEDRQLTKDLYQQIKKNLHNEEV